MKKKFILWLCKVFQVELVEPMQVTHHVQLVHEHIPYTLIQDNTQIQSNLHPEFYNSEIINTTKRDMLYRCIANMEKEGLITWKQFEEPMTRTTNLRCSFFVAPQKY